MLRSQPQSDTLKRKNSGDELLEELAPEDLELELRESKRHKPLDTEHPQHRRQTKYKPLSSSLFHPLTFFPGVKASKPCFNPEINDDLKKYIDTLDASSSTGWKPRTHQTVTFEKYYESRLSGKHSAVFHQATGSGKTFVAATLMTKLSGKNVFLVPTNLLETQAQKSLAKYYPGAKVSTVKKGFSNKKIAKLSSVSEKWNKLLEKNNIIISTYQWFQAYFEELDLNLVTAVYCDEFHNALSPKRSAMIRHIELHGCSILGLTATPTSTTKRLDGKGFNSCYKLLGYEAEGKDSIVPAFGLLDAIDKGVNTPVATALVKFSDSDNITFSGSSEISERNAAKKTNKPEYNKAIVELCLNGTNPRNNHSHRAEQGMIFCSGINHAADVAKTFKENLSVKALDPVGVLQERYNNLEPTLRGQLGEFSVAEAITSDLSKKESQVLLEKFKRGGIWILVGCDMVIEGMDNPYVGFIVNARPTRSLIIAKQRLGRGVRTLPSDVPNADSKVCMAYDIVWGRKTKINYCFQLINTQTQGDISWQYGEFKGQKADSVGLPESIHIAGAATSIVRYKPVIDQALKAKLLSLIKTESDWNISKGNANKNSEEELDLSEMHSELSEKTSAITENFSKLIQLLSVDTSQDFDSELHFATQTQPSASTAGVIAERVGSSTSSQPSTSSTAASPLEPQTEVSWISHLFDDESKVNNVAEIKAFLAVLDGAKRLVSEVKSFLRDHKKEEERTEALQSRQTNEKEVITLYRKFKAFTKDYLKTISRLKKALAVKLESTDESTFVNNSFDFTANTLDRMQQLFITDAAIQQELFQVSEQFDRVAASSQNKTAEAKVFKKNTFKIPDDAPYLDSVLDVSSIDCNLQKSVNNFEELRSLLTKLIQDSCLSYLIFENVDSNELRSINANDFLWGEEALQMNFSQKRATEILMLFHTCCRIEIQDLRWHDKRQSQNVFEKINEDLFAILTKFQSKPVVSHYLAIYFLEKWNVVCQINAAILESQKYIDYAIKNGSVMSHMLKARSLSRNKGQNSPECEQAFMIFINKFFLSQGKEQISSLGQWKAKEDFSDKFTRLLTPQIAVLLSIYSIEELFALSTDRLNVLGLQADQRLTVGINRIFISCECLRLLQKSSIKEFIANEKIIFSGLANKIDKLSFFISPWHSHLLREQLMFLLSKKLKGKSLMDIKSKQKPKRVSRIPYCAPSVGELFLKSENNSTLQFKLASLIVQESKCFSEETGLTTLASIINTQLTTEVKGVLEAILKTPDAYSHLMSLEKTLCELHLDEQLRVLIFLQLSNLTNRTLSELLKEISHNSSFLLQLKAADLSSLQKQIITSIFKFESRLRQASYPFSINFIAKIVLNPNLKASSFTVLYLHDVISMISSHLGKVGTGPTCSSDVITFEIFNKILRHHRKKLSQWRKNPSLSASEVCTDLLERKNHTIILQYLHYKHYEISKGEEQDIMTYFCQLYATVDKSVKPKKNRHKSRNSGHSNFFDDLDKHGLQGAGSFPASVNKKLAPLPYDYEAGANLGSASIFPSDDIVSMDFNMTSVPSEPPALSGPGEDFAWLNEISLDLPSLAAEPQTTDPNPTVTSSSSSTTSNPNDQLSP